MPSLASIIFPVTAKAETSLPLYNGRILHGSFLRWLEADHPEVVARLHDKNNPRPFTVSNLQGNFERNGQWVKIPEGASGWFRLTILEEKLSENVLNTLARQKRGPQPDDYVLVPGTALQSPDEHGWARTSSYEELAAEVQRDSSNHLPEHVTLRFDSPTCFIENGQALPLPMPRYVFGYLLNQWQMFSPLPIEDVQQFVESIFLSYARIETRMVDLKKYRRVGFVGSARFALHPAMPMIYRQALHVLARFAFYCGVGSHTTMGMGQVMQVEGSKGREGEWVKG